MLQRKIIAQVIQNPGPQGRLAQREIPCPEPREGEVLIRVAYAGVNRADLLQVKGLYPATPGMPDIPGLEVSGEIAALGKNVKHWKKGDKICALLIGGGYAEYCCADSGLLLPVPEGKSMEQAASLPEALATVWMALMNEAQLKQGESVLIHGGASGIGTFAIQTSVFSGATVFTTAGTDEKCALAVSLGAAKAVNYRTRDFTAEIKRATNGRGVDVVLDITGGENITKNMELLASEGRMVSIGYLRGAKAEVNIGQMLFKHIRWSGVALRRRPLAEKISIINDIKQNWWPAVAQGRIKTVIDAVFPLPKAEKALSRMEENLNLGKIVLQI